jgi:hypothetical protein
MAIPSFQKRLLLRVSWTSDGAGSPWWSLWQYALVVMFNAVKLWRVHTVSVDFAVNAAHSLRPILFPKPSFVP